IMAIIRFLLVFIILGINILASNKELSTIKDLQGFVLENTAINNRKIEKKYNIQLIIPNLLKKEMVFPEMNKGEIYLYKDGKRYVYLPIFNEVSEDRSDSDTNNFLNIMNYIIKETKENKEFRKNYYEGKIKKLSLKDNIIVNLLEYKSIEGYLLPTKIDVYSGKEKMGTLIFSNIKINQNLKEDDFKITDGNN
ncbi:MAG: LolA family protein, partial [Cetobacterium sp.]|uniref:LolA family protein n=1 Tax=Cetobacterium sp. TaxID=2071632 RepID=UPI003F357D74